MKITTIRFSDKEEKLYKSIKQFALDNDMSLAEVMKKGTQILILSPKTKGGEIK